MKVSCSLLDSVRPLPPKKPNSLRARQPNSFSAHSGGLAEVEVEIPPLLDEDDEE